MSSWNTLQSLLLIHSKNPLSEISSFIILCIFNTYTHETPLKAWFESEPHILIFRRNFLKVSGLSHRVFKFQSPFQIFLLKLIVVLHWEPTWLMRMLCEIYIYAFVPHLFSPFHSSLPTLFYNWHGFISHKVPLLSLLVKVHFYLYRASFAPLSSSAIFFPFSHLFVEALSADSYSKKENPLCSYSSIPPTLSLRAFIPQSS